MKSSAILLLLALACSAFLIMFQDENILIRYSMYYPKPFPFNETHARQVQPRNQTNVLRPLSFPLFYMQSLYGEALVLPVIVNGRPYRFLLNSISNSEASNYNIALFCCPNCTECQNPSQPSNIIIIDNMKVVNLLLYNSKLDLQTVCCFFSVP